MVVTQMQNIVEPTKISNRSKPIKTKDIIFPQSKSLNIKSIINELRNSLDALIRRLGTSKTLFNWKTLEKIIQWIK